MEEAARVEQVRRDVEDGKVPFLLLSLLLIFVAGDGGSGVVRHCRRRFEFLLTTASHSSGVGYGSWPLLNVSGLLLSYVLFDRHSYRWKFKHHLDRLGGFDTLLNDPDTTFGFHVSSTISAQFFPLSYVWLIISNLLRIAIIRPIDWNVTLTPISSFLPYVSYVE